MSRRQDTVVGKGVHLDTATGTPDLSGSNTRRLHICRMNPAFRADAASCMGGGVRLRTWKRESRYNRRGEPYFNPRFCS